MKRIWTFLVALLLMVGMLTIATLWCPLAHATVTVNSAYNEVGSTLTNERVASCSGTTKDTTVIQGDINSLAAQGGGTLYLPASTCEFVNVAPKSGVAIIGVEPSFVNSGNNNVFDAGRTFSSGTKIEGDGTDACIAANNTAQSLPSTGFGNNAISNFMLKNVYMTNCNGPVDIGATNNMGLYGPVIENVWLNNNQGPLDLENFVHPYFQNIFSYDDQGSTCGTYPGGMKFVASVGTNILIPGNGTIGYIADLRECRADNGIQFLGMGTADIGGSYSATLNQMIVQRVESQAFGQQAITDTITTDASGNGTVTTPADWEVNYAFTPTATACGLTANHEYFISTLNTTSGAVTVASARDVGAYVPTPVTLSASCTATLSTAGFPNLVMAGVSATGIENSSVQQIDTEGGSGAGNGLAVWLQGNTNTQLNFGAVNGLFANQLGVDSLSNGVRVVSATPEASGLSTDFYTNAIQYLGFGRGAVNGLYGTGCWNGMCVGNINVTTTAGATAQIGTGGTCTGYPGAQGLLENTNNGVIYVTTGTGTLSAGTLCTVTFAPPKPFVQALVYPLNAAAEGLVTSLHTNYALRSASFDIVSDTALTASTTYIFGYLSP